MLSFVSKHDEPLFPPFTSISGTYSQATDLNKLAKNTAPKEPIDRVSCRRYHKGFTLLELMLVLFIVILGFSVIGLNINSGNDTASHQSAARDLVSALRFAKGQALIGHEETTVLIDLNENAYTVSGRDKVFRLPENIELTVVTAQEELTGEGQAGIRFFSDGSSTGGRIKLERNDVLWQIDINWLTGQIELEKM